MLSNYVLVMRSQNSFIIRSFTFNTNDICSLVTADDCEALDRSTLAPCEPINQDIERML